MYGRDPLLPLAKLLQPKVRYLGNDENILSLEVLKNMYQLVVTNLKLAHEKRQPNLYIDPRLKEVDLVLVKDHTAKEFQPRFKGNYRVVSQKGNQVEIGPVEGGETTKFHVTDFKKIIPVDQAITQLPDCNKLGCLTNLRLNLKNIPNLDWQLASELHTTPVLYHTAKIGNQIMSTGQTIHMVTTEVITKTTKLRID